ncbi:DUF2058 domain-containing protein [Agaribacterium sp. ZY112]|uniref:DUF2058 domain-containing protein n=1 Tax=Agaribacterium sp. ZY112 TaxID=3233574 RepID=UPI0035255712
MSKSLQDQLMGAGLIDKKKAKKLANSAKKEKFIKQKARQDTEAEKQAKLKQAQQEKKERDQELNRKLKEEADQKAIFSQVKQLVSHYRISDRQGDLEYNFNDGGKIKKLRLEKLVFEKVSRGLLCIVVIDGVYDLIPRPVADKISERMPELIVVDNSVDKAVSAESSSQSDSEDGLSDEDYYADFEIPDDLMW